MIIGIDGNEANVEQRVGIGEYSFELLRQFKEFKIQNSKFKIYLKNKPLEHMPKESGNWKYKIIGPKGFWTQLALPFHLLFDSVKPDVFFTPSHYAPRFAKMPTVISVMDLSYLYYPNLFKKMDLYQLRRWTSYSVKNAKRVLTISQASKNDIIKEYKKEAKDVVVTYPGVKQKMAMKDAKKRFIEEKYILFVGTLQPRKNIVKLIEAFSKITDKHSVNLVVAGKKGWLYEEIMDAPKAYGVESRVVFKNFIEDEELVNLYSHAELFILPSLYEGFGLPVLEAMQYGCPVITSSVSSLPEVGGDAVLYVDPLSVEDIANKMNQLLSDDNLRTDLIKKGYEQIKKFSWEKTARETLNILEEVAGK